MKDGASGVSSRWNASSIIGAILLWTSIGLLYPGITGNLIHYKVVYDIEWLGRGINVKEEVRTLWGDDEGNIIGTLYEHGAVWTARLLIFFGIVIPLFKVIAFHSWLLTEPGTATRRLAEKGVGVMGKFSRWVAVDAVVEAMFVGMMMQIPSVSADHREAFICFVFYCIFSAIAFLLIGSAESSTPSQTSVLVGRFVRAVPITNILLSVAFFALLYKGSTDPCFHIRIPPRVIEEAARDKIKDMGTEGTNALSSALEEHLVKGMADTIKIDSEITIYSCVVTLLTSGLLYSVVGAVVLFFCVLVVPSLNMILGTVGPFVEGPVLATVERCRGTLHHFLMLDVLLVGMVLGVMTTKCEPNIKASLLPAFVPLMAASGIYYVQAYLADASGAAAKMQSSKFGDVEQPEDQQPLMTES